MIIDAVLAGRRSRIILEPDASRIRRVRANRLARMRFGSLVSAVFLRRGTLRMSSPSVVSMDRAASSDTELLTPNASGPAPSDGAHPAGENGAASTATSGDENS